MSDQTILRPGELLNRILEQDIHNWSVPTLSGFIRERDKAIVKSLVPYMEHKPDCLFRIYGFSAEGRCTCGLDETIRQITE
jgi:hypothetical protein